MFTIRFITELYAPGRQVTSDGGPGPSWDIDRGGVYVDGAWTFELDETEFQQGIEFKFVLAPGHWMSGDNRRLAPEECVGTHELSEADVQFPLAQELVTERGVVAQLFFVRNLDPNHVYDVIVVGSGMGGGILASKLARAGKDVLLLEAGSYLFPTHVGNLPRHLQIGQFDKHIWSLWPEFQVRAYVNEPGSAYDGAQAFNLGGRSLFWGGLIPRQQKWELQAWPTAVREYLLGAGYPEAEAEIGSVDPLTSAYQEKSRAYLDSVFADYIATNAPMAVQYRGATELSIPAGFFSTADLLMEDRLLPQAFNKPTVNLNFAVWSVLTDPTTPTKAIGATGWDLLAQKERQFLADTVILSAGTIETAKIALQSGFGLANNQIGRSITDHTIRYRHFLLPTTSDLFDKAESGKVLLRHPAATVDEHAFDIVVELGADLNQCRYVDPDNLALERAARAGSMVGEIVFMHYAALNNANAVTVSGVAADPVRLTVKPVTPPQADLDESDALASSMLESLGAQLLAPDTQWTPLAVSGVGNVAHEVGTMRMADDESGVVDADLKMLGFDNLYVCDNSVFPTSPAANPSLTLAALALRLSAHLT